MMTDREARQMLDTIAQYARDAVAEGQPIDEVADLTLREVAEDLISSLPAHLTLPEDLPQPIAAAWELI